MGIILEGVGEFVAALKRAEAAMNVATGAATSTGAHLVQARVQQKLTESSHKKGTPTPASPGEPPSLVSGSLRRSVRVDGPRDVGMGGWEARVGPTVIYSRVQELGGGPSELPARPYVEPALREAEESGDLREAYVAAWRRVWRP